MGQGLKSHALSGTLQKKRESGLLRVKMVPVADRLKYDKESRKVWSLLNPRQCPPNTPPIPLTLPMIHMRIHRMIRL